MTTPQSLAKLRSIVQDSLGKHLYENAIFFADKLVTLSHGEPDDVYRLAQAYVFTKQHRRALHVINKTKQATASSRFRYLTARCLAECQELDECLTMLDDAALKVVAAEEAAGGMEGQVNMLSAMQLLRGSVFESQENWPLAARCYTAALHADALCYEALDRLVNNHMISTSEQVLRVQHGHLSLFLPPSLSPSLTRLSLPIHSAPSSPSSSPSSKARTMNGYYYTIAASWSPSKVRCWRRRMQATR